MTLVIPLLVTLAVGAVALWVLWLVIELADG